MPFRPNRNSLVNPEKGDVMGTVHQEVSRLRRCLGGEHFPEAKGGYRLAASVECDWDHFCALSEAARAMPEDHSVEVLTECLGLVRGQPFDVGSGTYSWAFDEVLVAKMETAVAKAAHAMSGRCLAMGRHAEAAWAVRQAILAGPLDEQVREDQLRVAAATAGRVSLDQAWDDVQGALGPQPVGSPLEVLYRRLRSSC
jgi:two-component SAPR family response regulator